MGTEGPTDGVYETWAENGPQSQTDLVVAAQHGDGKAFEVLVGPLLGGAYRLASAVLGNSLDAEDAVQEATLRAWNKLSQMRRDRPLRPWYMAIVVNECKSRLRRSRRRSRIDALLPGGEADATAADVAQEVDLARALNTLTLDQRSMVLLVYYVGFSIDEAAQSIGIRPGTARSRLSRALQRLAFVVEEDK